MHEISVYPRANVYTSKERAGAVVSIEAVLRRIRNGEKGLAKNTALLRQYLATGKDELYKKAKAKILPAVTFSGVFSIRDASVPLVEKWTLHSELITIDIDGIRSPDLPRVYAALRKHPHVLLVFCSPSGTGLKVVCRISPTPTTENDNEHKDAWDTVSGVFDAILKRYDLECDRTGNDPTRLCFLAHDPDAFYNPNAQPLTWNRDAFLAKKAPPVSKAQDTEQNTLNRTHLDTRKWESSDIDPAALDFIPNNQPYETWRNIGMAIKDAGLPKSVFENWTGGQRLDSKGNWIKENIDRYWNSFSRSGITWGTVVHLAQQNGYVIPQRKRAPKLQRTAEIPENEPEPLQTLDENREQRAIDADVFLSADSENETQTVRLHIVRDATGTGKSHTYLTKARQHGKRTLAQLPTQALAAQAVDVAWQAGFTNAFSLIGREHNWENSGIASIPIAERTAELFDKNLCIMCDKIQEYVDKRLAARWYCETKCLFREDCLYLKQYEGLGDRDFIATPTPNLLFNPNFTGYLDALVNSGSEITDTDMALDAMLGTNSDDIKPFDFAILDDYTVDGLYTEIDIRETEFKAIKNAWRGTPTGHFAALVLKAFQKRKPAKIVKRLRKAVDETAEHHAEIADTLTQHARSGIIDFAETPVSSKETKRLLAEKIVRYTDKGTQLIPVDFAAYKELKEKGTPVVHPKKLDDTDVGTQVRIPHTPLTAIRAGVPLTELTPTWQRGVTPLELLRLFLESIGNDTDAPIARKFTSATLKDSTEKKPPAILTFSIPPQAPNGILTEIALLSASTEIDDVKRAFDKQDVAISEYTGAPVAWQSGVKGYQFADARLTTASTFEYPTDTDGKRRLQEKPVSLTNTAAKRIAKLNEFAIATEGKTVFISYKEFTEQFADTVDGFDEVAHFDNITGINFDGLKILVVFGYPKVNHLDVMASARRQHARDTTPLPKQDKSLVHTEGKNKGRSVSEYEQLTETAEITEDGIRITERRYKDARLDAIRKQLSIEKLTQGVGRARLATWRDTTTIIFTNAPIPNVSDRATLFTSAGFNISNTPHALETAEQRLTQAEQAGDVDAIMAQQGVSQRTAYEKAKNATAKKAADRKTRNAEIRQRAAAGETHQNIAIDFGITRQAVSKIIGDAARDPKATNCKDQLSTLIGTCKELPNSENPVATCVDAASPAASPGLADTPSNLQSDAAEPKVTQPNTPRDTRIIELHQAEHSNRKIAEIMTAEGYEKVSEGTVRRVVTNHTARQTPENEPENEPQPIPPSEYRHLTETAARAELERLTAGYNYNATAILRRVFRDKKWKL